MNPSEDGSCVYVERAAKWVTTSSTVRLETVEWWGFTSVTWSFQVFLIFSLSTRHITSTPQLSFDRFVSLHLSFALIIIILSVHGSAPATLYSPPEGECGCFPGNVQHWVDTVRSHYYLISSSSLRLCSSEPNNDNNNNNSHHLIINSIIFVSFTAI